MTEQNEQITPGPWRAKWTDDGRCGGIAPDYHNHEGPDCYEYSRPGFMNCPYQDEIVTTDSGVYGPSPADARLIAAAPDLLAALKALVAEVESRDNVIDEGADSDCEQMISARAALAKAEGRDR